MARRHHRRMRRISKVQRAADAAVLQGHGQRAVGDRIGHRVAVAAAGEWRRGIEEIAGEGDHAGAAHPVVTAGTLGPALF